MIDPLSFFKNNRNKIKYAPDNIQPTNAFCTRSLAWTGT